MGTYAYMLVAGVVVFGGLSAVSMRSDNRIAEDSVAGVHYKEEARDAAVTGMNLTVRRIVNDEGLWTNADHYQIDTTDYRSADFWTTVVPMGDSITVTSVGRKEAVIGRGGVVYDTTHTIEAKIVRLDLAGGVPPGFEVAILTDTDMSIRGNFYVSSLDPELNADVHANGTLETRGNTFLVEGFGSYTNRSRVRYPDGFQPNYDFNGTANNVVQQDTIPLPPIDIPEFRENAQIDGQGLYHAGDVNVDQAYLDGVAGQSASSFGDLAAGLGLGSDVGTTPEKPFVFFSEGAIDFTGSVSLDGYGAFVSVSSIHINSNVNITGEIGEDFRGNPTTQMGIFTAGDAMINGTTNIQATIYVAGETVLNGDANITGGAIMYEFTMQTGNFNLLWVGPNEGIVTNFGGYRTVIGPVIVAWAEW
jgi:hypothetical protein